MADTTEQKNAQEDHMAKLEKLASQASMEFVSALAGLINVAQRPAKTKDEAEKEVNAAATRVLETFVGATQNIALYVSTQLVDHMNELLDQADKEEK